MEWHWKIRTIEHGTLKILILGNSHPWSGPGILEHLNMEHQNIGTLEHLSVNNCNIKTWTGILEHWNI